MADGANEKNANPADLVSKVARGDAHALGALYDMFGTVVYSLALAITGASTEAESVVADTFAEARRSAAQFAGGTTSVLAWLSAIARREALARSSVRVAERPATGADVGAGAPAVGLALRSLTGRQREAITLSYYRGLTVGQLAAHLGEPESGARELLRTAMQELRSALGGATVGDVYEERVVTRV